MVKPEPTTRFVIEPSLECNIRCKFCYHLHRYDQWKETRKPAEKILADIDAGIARGNDYMDITGGEPTMYPYIADVVEYAKANGIKSCIITNGIVSEKRTDEIIEAGVDDWLVSRHGLEKTHDFVTNNPGGYRRQLKFLDLITQRGMTFRFNVVINHWDQEELLEMAKEMVGYQPRIVNFINMNPHHEWLSKELETKEVIADLSIAQPILEQAIQYLESCNIGVNVRYYPMCCLKEEYRRCICNDLHVMFDPYEWDYNILPKTVEAFKTWGINTSNNVELKDYPCSTCDLQYICGGVNKAFFKASDGRGIKPQNFNGDLNDFYFYRKENIMTLGG